MSNAQIAIVAAMTATMEPAQQPSFDAIIESIEQSRAQVEQMAHQEVLTSFLYTYRTLTDKELDRYIAFAESAAGRKYHEVTVKAINNVFIAVSWKTGTEFGKKIQAKQSMKGA